ncbi:MAG: type II toxin-antitoxin system VapC family toxin [Alphaproteobacteria bacterium]|nr:type II toxin-antitoxin system VapC family toxin [Alphaproteobacteria bacterium]
MNRYVWDTSALASVVNTNDEHNKASYQFYQEHNDSVYIFPAIAWFEFQAAVSRRNREGHKVQRDLYVLDGKNIVFDVDQELIARASERRLFEKFSSLRGADLIFACIAYLEEAALVTNDRAFESLNEIQVIVPGKSAEN